MLDIYDPNGDWLGVKSRDTVHRDGDWHRVFHCWIIYRAASGEDFIMMQKRGPDKPTYPNLLDVTAAGHYQAGETIADGVREIEEELGLLVDFSALVSLGRRVGTAAFDGIIDYEVADVFFLVADWPLSDYRPHPDEVAGLVRLNIAQALELVTEQRDSITGDAVGLGTSQVTVRRDELVPSRIDAYFYKILLLAKRCLNSESGLVI
jgi:isopentenyldiphosphate isomerase